MATKQTSTPKKGGLSISRKGDKFTVTWTPIKDCTDQDIKVYLNNYLVKTKDLGKNSKSFSYTIDRSCWYPNMTTTPGERHAPSGAHAVEGPKFTEIAFRLARKQKGKTESKYSDQKEWKNKAPRKPKYVPPVMDSTNHDTFTYSWEKNAGDGDAKTSHYMYTRYFWQTCLVDKGQEPDWSLAGTQKITTINTTTGEKKYNQDSKGTIGINSTLSVIIVETQADINARKKRWFRVRAVGPGGTSPFQDKISHQLGGEDSYKPTDSEYIGSDESGTSAVIPLDGLKGNPNDSIQVQYAIVTPKVTVATDSEHDFVRSSLSLPQGFNSWSTADTFSGTGAPDNYYLKVNDQIVDNTVLFARVNYIHDNITTYGYPILTNKRDSTIVPGPLSAPTLDTISVNENTKTVTIGATNTCNIPGSFIAVYQDVDGLQNIIGIISSSGTQTKTFPGDWPDDVESEKVSFGIQCFVADYSPINRAPEGATFYKLSNVYMMSSGIIWEGGILSMAPVITGLVKYDSTTALLSWEWNWSQADSAEISWSTNKIMWEATTDPSSYIVTNSRSGNRYITGLSADTYYFRVRFINTSGDTVVYSKYSEFAELKLSEAPSIPSISLSDVDAVVALNDKVTVYWKYQSNDGTEQAMARLGEASRPDADSPWSYTPLDKVTNTDTHFEFTPAELGWENNTVHYVAVTVRSASGEDSDGWSSVKQITVAPLPSIGISGIADSIDSAIQSEYDSEQDVTTYNLVKLPLEFNVTGFGNGGFCNVVIERADRYEMERPDDSKLIGFAGETILSERFDPDEEDSTNISVLIWPDDPNLIGHLDNTATYIMTVSITDQYGQHDSRVYPFTVNWNRYAQDPSATITIDRENDVAVITPSAPQELGVGDYCQIYRLSADKPQLVLERGEFGTSYVDTYPTFGYFGGYRIVYITGYGDYKTEDNMLAMTEYSKAGNDQDIDQYDRFVVSINYDDNVIEFPGNISLSASWAKDFQTTKYLGGSVQGDWNLGVSRTGSINGTVPVEQEIETVHGLRLLADYAGVCHVRTPEGSNFYADVQVKDDREEKWVNRIQKVSLSYTKVDGVEDSLITYDEWSQE